jgi:hypothetical protein
MINKHKRMIKYLIKLYANIFFYKSSAYIKIIYFNNCRICSYMKLIWGRQLYN